MYVRTRSATKHISYPMLIWNLEFVLQAGLKNLTFFTRHKALDSRDTDPETTDVCVCM